MDNHITGLFPITQAAEVCGLSRSTLMRMEERGLLTPAYIAPKSKILSYFWASKIFILLHLPLVFLCIFLSLMIFSLAGNKRLFLGKADF